MPPQMDDSPSACAGAAPRGEAFDAAKRSLAPALELAMPGDGGAEHAGEPACSVSSGGSVMSSRERPPQQQQLEGAHQPEEGGSLVADACNQLAGLLNLSETDKKEPILTQNDARFCLLPIK